MNIGLLFGSFNPIHIGHLIIANTMLEEAKFDEVWFVITPQNPYKINQFLMDENERLKMVNLAIFDHHKLKSSTIEFDLPKPNYTIHTLNILKEKYSNHSFSIIIGSDNLTKLHQWKEAEKIIENFKIVVYPRLNKVSLNDNLHHNIKIYDCPFIDISSTLIREKLKSEKSIKYLVHQDVQSYLEANKKKIL